MLGLAGAPMQVKVPHHLPIGSWLVEEVRQIMGYVCDTGQYGAALKSTCVQAIFFVVDQAMKLA